MEIADKLRGARIENKEDHCNVKISKENGLKNRRGLGKAALMIEMMREAGIPARYHFILVKKEALKDIVHPFAYPFWPKKFGHFYPEINFNGKWIPVDGAFDVPVFQNLAEMSPLV